jgi:hypothetical protein
VTPAVNAVSPPIALGAAVPVAAPPWRVWRWGAEFLWLLGFALAIPLAILAVGAPVALVVKLVFFLFGWR